MALRRSRSSNAPPPLSRPHPGTFRRRLVDGTLIALAASLVYGNTLHNTFALDDFYRVVDNPGIQQVWPPWRHFADPRTMSTLDRITQYRPLLPLSLSLNYAISGESPVGFHLGNLLLQSVAGLVVYFLALELLRHWSSWRIEARRGEWLALAIALLFTVHPVSGIPVNYVSARDLLMMEVFLAGALLAYVRMRRLGDTPLRWASVLALLALSLLSKTNGVVAPLLILAFELTAGRKKPGDLEPWLRATPFVAVAAAFFAFTKLVLGFSDVAMVLDSAGPSPAAYALTQARLHLFHYLRNFIWPFAIRQAPAADVADGLLEPGVLIGLAFILLTLYAAWRWRRSAPLMSFCILAYWILLLPESSILPFHQVVTDYRPYPSSVFLFLLLAVLLERRTGPRLTTVVVAAAILYFAVTAFALNRTWRTGETLWTHSVSHGGDQLAHLNLAMSIRDRRDPRVRAHLEEALRIKPDYVLAHINLGLLLIDTDHVDEGLDHLQTAVRLNPGWAQTHFWLGRAYRQLGRKQEAAEESATAARLDAKNLEYQYRAALDAQAEGDFAGSQKYVDAIWRVRPDYGETALLRGLAFQMTGRLEDAVEVYEALLARTPDDVQAQFNLGHALMRLGRCAEAVPRFKKTLELRPDYLAAHLHLATCYAELGDPAAAEVHRRQSEGRAS